MNPHSCRFPAALALFVSATAVVALAQPAPAPANATAPTDEIIELSPFQVSTQKDVGYLANNTLAGSRIRTDLTDVANAISVFTPEFMSDINAFSEADVMKYSASAVPERTDQTPAVQGIAIDTGGFQFRIRGQAATRTRNYFSTELIPDVYNSERFEEARGPNAILFGLGGAGGIVNTSTKTAKLTRTFTNASLTGDNFGLLRAHIDHNHKLNDRLALRLNALHHTADGWQEHQSVKNERIHVSGTYRPWERATIRVDAEYGHVKNTLARIYAPFDNISQWKLSGSPLVASGTANANPALGIGRRNATPRVTFVGNDSSFRNFQQTVFSQATAERMRSVLLPADWAAIDRANPYPETASFSGPGGTSEFRQKSFSAFLELEPVKKLFVELAAVSELRDHDVHDTTHEVFRVLGEPAQTFRDGAPNPYAGSYYVDTRWVLRSARNSGDRYRATASYSLDLGKFGRHNLAGMASREYNGNPRHVSFLVLQGSPFNAQPQNAANQIWTRQYVTNPADPGQYAAPDFRRIPSQFSVVMDPGAAPRTFSTAWEKNELNDQWSHTDTRLATIQSYFLKDRLVATAGWSQTRLANFSRPTNNPNSQTPARPDSFGPLRFIGDAPPATTFDFERVSYGLVAKPTKWASVFCNYSENGQPPGTTQTLIPNSSPFPLNAGEGEDYGVMLSLLEGRVFVRAGYFSTASVDQAKAYGASNVAVRNDRIMDAMVAAGLINASQAVRFTGGDFDLADLSTDGYELNLTANVTPAWRVMFNLAKSESVETNMLKRSRPAAAQVLPLWRTPAAQGLVTSAGVTVAQEIANYENWLASTTAVENEGTIGHRELELRGFTRYDFRAGRLKGLFIGGGFTYGSGPAIGRSAAGEVHRAAVRREADALIGYKTRLPDLLGRAAIELQLNASNLLQQSPYTLVRRDPDGQYFRAVLNAPTTYSFSTRINF